MSQEPAIEQVERQMERASLFTHAALRQLGERLENLEAMVGAMVEALTQPDGQGADEGEPAPGQAEGMAWPGIALRVDSAEEREQGPVPVNCAERMHVCHAVCCKLPIPLSAEEVEAGRVKWDLGHPYMIRQERDGFCTHHDRATGCCGIYPDRPGVCRRYSCANDGRIWKNFDSMVLNEDWLAANLPATGRMRLLPIIRTGPDGSAATRS